MTTYQKRISLLLALAFAAQIEEHWGDWLIDNICIPLRVDRGACIAMALQVAMETSSDWPTEQAG